MIHIDFYQSNRHIASRNFSRPRSRYFIDLLFLTQFYWSLILDRFTINKCMAVLEIIAENWSDKFIKLLFYLILFHNKRHSSLML
jgi:hypothetical protein